MAAADREEVAQPTSGREEVAQPTSGQPPSIMADQEEVAQPPNALSLTLSQGKNRKM